MIYQEDITCLEDWGKVFHRKESFEPLVKTISERHRLEYSPVENCIPGSNAVFKAGKYIPKFSHRRKRK